MIDVLVVFVVCFMGLLLALNGTALQLLLTVKATIHKDNMGAEALLPSFFNALFTGYFLPRPSH